MCSETTEASPAVNYDGSTNIELCGICRNAFPKHKLAQPIAESCDAKFAVKHAALRTSQGTAFICLKHACGYKNGGVWVPVCSCTHTLLLQFHDGHTKLQSMQKPKHLDSSFKPAGLDVELCKCSL
jgi:hypothetical protein